MRGLEAVKVSWDILSARVGDPVTVNLTDLYSGDVSDQGVSTSGVIAEIDPARKLIMVRLDADFGGMNMVTVPADRVSLSGA